MVKTQRSAEGAWEMQRATWCEEKREGLPDPRYSAWSWTTSRILAGD